MKNALLDSDTTLDRKVQEAAIAFQLERNLTKERGLRATYVPSLDIDGEPALGRQIRRALVGGDAILQVAYLVIHEGYGYSIGLNSQEGDSDAGAAFDGVVSSWIWVD